MAQAADTFLDLAVQIRAMRREAAPEALAANIPGTMESLCLLLHAAKVGRRFCAEEVVLKYGFNCTRSIRLLLEAGVLESSGRARADLRKKPLQITEEGLGIVAAIDRAMACARARAAEVERVAA